jgi:hypothetical protein
VAPEDEEQPEYDQNRAQANERLAHHFNHAELYNRVRRLALTLRAN